MLKRYSFISPYFWLYSHIIIIFGVECGYKTDMTNRTYGLFLSLKKYWLPLNIDISRGELVIDHPFWWLMVLTLKKWGCKANNFMGIIDKYV